MKKRNIFASLWVAILLLVTVTATVAFADQSAVSDQVAEIASTPYNTRQGETFTTTIYIADNANIIDFGKMPVKDGSLFVHDSFI